MEAEKHWQSSRHSNHDSQAAYGSSREPIYASWVAHIQAMDVLLGSVLWLDLGRLRLLYGLLDRQRSCGDLWEIQDGYYLGYHARTNVSRVYHVGIHLANRYPGSDQFVFSQPYS